MTKKTKVTLLAGGVGGAKMAEGFAACDDVDLRIIGNIADDECFHGLWVSPDIDTLTYTLAGLVNRDQGWGVSDEGLRALETLKTLGSDTWMTLGDRDFGLHIYRTERLRKGDRPSHIARDIAGKFGVTAEIILPTDDRVQTRVRTAQGWCSFQEYFVRDRCAPEVMELAYDGIHDARVTPEAIDALQSADVIVIAPSNPMVSIAPILGVAELKAAFLSATAPKLAVSPLVDGKVIKGPADRMMRAMGMRADALGVAEFYQGLCDTLVIDNLDAALKDQISALGLGVFSTEIVIPTAKAKQRLAQYLTELAASQTDKVVAA